MSYKWNFYIIYKKLYAIDNKKKTFFSYTARRRIFIYESINLGNAHEQCNLDLEDERLKSAPLYRALEKSIRKI